MILRKSIEGTKVSIACSGAGVTLAPCTKTCCHDTWDLHIHSIHQSGGVTEMLRHISRDSENVVLLKQSHTIIIREPKSPQFKFPKAQIIIKVGICHSKCIFSLHVHWILDTIIVRS